jgi:hypothetical protein
VRLRGCNSVHPDKSHEHHARGKNDHAQLYEDGPGNAHGTSGNTASRGDRTFRATGSRSRYCRLLRPKGMGEGGIIPVVPALLNATSMKGNA